MTGGRQTEREFLEAHLECGFALDAVQLADLNRAKIRTVELLNRAEYLVNGRQFAPARIEDKPESWFQAMRRFFRESPDLFD